MEVMIFLAISGVMFLMAVNLVSGKQAKAEFKQSMNQVNSEIRQSINDVGNGLVPSSNFTCTADGSGAKPTIDSGTNTGCVFIGKVLHFRVNGTNDLGYNLYSVAGRQYVNSATDGALVSNLVQAKPTTILPITESKTLKWGARFTRITSSGTNINGVGFFSTFGRSLTGDNQQSGSQSVQVVPYTGAANISAASMAPIIDNGTTDANVVANPNIVLCFDDGGGNQRGMLTIGGNGQRLTTEIAINTAAARAACP